MARDKCEVSLAAVGAATSRNRVQAVLTLNNVVGGLLMARRTRYSKMFRIASTPSFRAFLKKLEFESKCPYIVFHDSMIPHDTAYTLI